MRSWRPSTSSLRTFYNTGWTNFCPALSSCPNGEERHQDEFIQYMLDHRLTSRLGAVPIVNGVRDISAFLSRHARFFDGTSGVANRADEARILPGARVTSFAFEPYWPADLQTRDPQLYLDWKAVFGSWYYMDDGAAVRAFDYTCDEPGNTGSECFGGAEIPPRASSVHGLTPDFPTLVTAPNSQYRSTGSYCRNGQVPGDPYIMQYGSSIDLAVANSNHVRNAVDNGAFLGLPACTNVSEVWWYQSCDVHGCGSNTSSDRINQPSLMIDVGCTSGSPCGDQVSGAQNRAMQWFTYYYRFKGELYWDYIASFAQSATPWTNVSFAGGNGDGTLLYPWTQADVGGTTRVPVPSLRLKILRDGLEDYEYLSQLDALCPGEARTKIGELFGTPINTRSANIPAAQLYAVRAQIADRIAAVKGNPALCGSSPPPPPPPPPDSCPPAYPYDCCGDGSACMATRAKCDVVACY